MSVRIIVVVMVRIESGFLDDRTSLAIHVTNHIDGTHACGSDTLSRVISITTGFGDIGLGSEVSIHPNPNHGSFVLSVQAAASAAYTAEITDMMGHTVSRQPIHSGENEFNLILPAGIYLVKVSDGARYTLKTISIK